MALGEGKAESRLGAPARNRFLLALVKCGNPISGGGNLAELQAEFGGKVSSVGIAFAMPIIVLPNGLRIGEGGAPVSA